MPKLLIFDAFTLLICEKTVANYALLRCKTFSLKIWVCKIFDKFHVWVSDYSSAIQPLGIFPLPSGPTNSTNIQLTIMQFMHFVLGKKRMQNRMGCAKYRGFVGMNT